MARRRHPEVGARERYRAGLVELHEMYGRPGYPQPDPSWAAQIARVDAGETIRCNAYEVDLLPAMAHIEIDARGTITVLD